MKKYLYWLWSLFGISFKLDLIHCVLLQITGTFFALKQNPPFPLIVDSPQLRIFLSFPNISLIGLLCCVLTFCPTFVAISSFAFPISLSYLLKVETSYISTHVTHFPPFPQIIVPTPPSLNFHLNNNVYQISISGLDYFVEHYT